ncbi:MAG: MotA/TolQ/ExbB proton channel family protein [Pseudomonadales bacterium]|jgi:biopolymer transport protein ExbB
MSDSFDALLSFMGLGGTVLWLIALLVFAMWTLILERLIFHRVGYRAFRHQLLEVWTTREDKSSWYARRIREAMLSRAGQAIDRNMALIKTLILLCPLFGLLGTVTGMIEVFTVLSVAGSGDVKPIAAGISRATIPTMAGMVAALSGVFAMTWLSRRAVREKALIQDQLDIGTG